MTEKVKVSREVAEAFEALEKSSTLTEIFNAVTADYEIRDHNFKCLKSWNSERGDEGADLMNLLLGNYEVEQTPEEYLKVRIDHNRQLFKDESSKNNPWQYRYHDGFIDGALETLSILGIKIKGVNE